MRVRIDGVMVPLYGKPRSSDGQCQILESLSRPINSNSDPLMDDSLSLNETVWRVSEKKRYLGIRGIEAGSDRELKESPAHARGGRGCWLDAEGHCLMAFNKLQAIVFHSIP
jgi:hypothetical protein